MGGAHGRGSRRWARCRAARTLILRETPPDSAHKKVHPFFPTRIRALLCRPAGSQNQLINFGAGDIAVRAISLKTFGGRSLSRRLAWCLGERGVRKNNGKLGMLSYTQRPQRSAKPDLHSLPRALLPCWDVFRESTLAHFRAGRYIFMRCQLTIRVFVTTWELASC